MRNFKRLNKTTTNRLNTLFPNIEHLYAKEDSNDYGYLSVSVFDHWLNQDEARKEIDRVNLEKEKINDSKLHNFCYALASENECYLVKLRGMRKSDVTFREFSSLHGCKESLRPMPYNCGSNGRFVLVFPKMEFVYFEDWDFTHHIYYKNSENLDQLRAQVEKHEVFILEEL